MTDFGAGDIILTLSLHARTHAHTRTRIHSLSGGRVKTTSKRSDGRRGKNIESEIQSVLDNGPGPSSTKRKKNNVGMAISAPSFPSSSQQQQQQQQHQLDEHQISIIEDQATTSGGT